MRKKVVMTFIVLFLFGLCWGAAKEWIAGGVRIPPPEKRHEVEPEDLLLPPETSPLSDDQEDLITVNLYFSDGEAMYLKPEQRRLEDSRQDKVKMVIGKLIRGPKGEDLIKTVPPNALLRSVWIDEGVAYVDFSREFQTEHWGGSTGDTFTLFSIVNSLTELPGINAVQFLIEGEIEEAILGHTDTTQPISRRDDLICPE